MTNLETAELLFNIRTVGTEQLRRAAVPVRELKREVQGAPVLFDHLGRTVTRVGASTEQVAGQTKKLSEETKRLGEEQKRTGTSFADSAVKFTALTAAIGGAVATIKAATIDSAAYAARTQTLWVVTDRLAKANNLSRDAVRSQVLAVREAGITTQEALQTVNKMIFAQLDLAKATDLARLAQNAAVIAGINSSDALAGIIHGVVTRQPEVLRTYGIIVTFEQEFTKASRALGRELTNAEKTQVAMNVVLREGAKITGAYEAAMTTAGKQVTSLKRYIDEAKDAVGQQFIPAFGRTISILTEMAKWTQENAVGFSKLASGITAAGVAAAAFKLTPGPLPLKVGVAGAAGIGTYMFGQQDPVKYYTEAGATAIESLNRKQQSINKRLGKTTDKIDAEFIKGQFDAIEEQKAEIRQQITEELAKIYVQRGKGVMFEAERLTQGVSQGALNIPRGEILEAVKKQKAGPGEGVTGELFNRKAYEELIAEALREQSAQKVKEAQKKVDQILQSLSEQNLDPLNKLAADEAEALRLLRKSGASRQQLQAVRGGFQTRRGELINELMPIRPGFESFDAESRAMLGAAQQQIQSAMDTETTRSFAPGGGLFNLRRESEALQFAEQYREETERTDKEHVDSLRRELAFRQRFVELIAGPGGERNAIEQLFQERLDLANRELQITRNRAEYEAQVDEARKERVISILELQRKELEEYRQQAGQIFDALTQRGATGLKDFLTGQLRVIQRTIFVNIAEEFYRSSRDKLKLGGAIPGQQDSGGNLTLLGRILRGTPFGVDQNQIAVTANTTATLGNTAAITEMTASLRAMAMSPSGGGGGRVLDYAGAGISLLSGVAGGGRGISLGAPELGTTDIGPGGLPIGATRSAGAGRWGALSQGLGFAGIGAAGAIGTIAGIRQGGFRGAMTAGSSLAGAASGILSLAGVSGPAAPILGAIGLGLSLFGGLLGSNKRKRDEEISKTLERSQFKDEAKASNLVIDASGASVGFDFRGNVRTVSLEGMGVNVPGSTGKPSQTEFFGPSSGSPFEPDYPGEDGGGGWKGPPGRDPRFEVNQTIRIEVQALDSRDVIARGPVIAEAVRRELQRGHALASEIQNLPRG